MALLTTDLEACNRTIVARMDSPVALIPQLAAHIVAAGGKRLRPLLTLAAARLCGYADGDDRHVKLAACVEFIHTATLLHDDVVDESLLRRGLASRERGVRQQGLGAGRRFPVRPRLPVDGRGRLAASCSAILSRAAATIAEGEVLQLVTQNDLTTSEARYLEVIKGKTAALFAAACEVGAVVAGRPASEAAALAEFGMNLGIAFQLVDDALDYAADQAVLGKTVGDDFREGKITLPVLVAYQAGDAADRDFWRRTIEAIRAERSRPRSRAAPDGRCGAIRATLDARRRISPPPRRRPWQRSPDTALRRALMGRGGLHGEPRAIAVLCAAALVADCSTVRANRLSWPAVFRPSTVVHVVRGGKKRVAPAPP